MSEKTKKRIRGSISVLLVIILVPMMTLSAVIVDTSRINMAKAMVSSAGDLTMNAALANYDTILKDVYGLFAMSQYKDDKKLSEDLKAYFEKTLVSYGATTETESGEYVEALIGDFSELLAGVRDGSVTNLMDMDVMSGFEVNRVEASSLAHADIMRTQIVEYMKYRAPANFGLSFLDSLKAFKNVQNQTSVVEKQVAAQESTQDVAHACKDVIDEIRVFDKLIDSIQSGDKAVKGKLDKNDGVTIPLVEYHEQVDRYRTDWGDNYKDINELTMVFLLKSPSTGSVYLKDLSYPRSEFFIKNDKSGLVYQNSGISVSTSMASDTGGAQNQVRSQITKLASGAEKNAANAYKNAMSLHLSSTNIALDLKSFTDKEKAIVAFAAFERFLVDDASAEVSYSSVKNALEQIYILGKYYDNFASKIDADIEGARQEKESAQRDLNNANSNASKYQSKVSNAVSAINRANTDWNEELNFLNGIRNSGMDLQAEASRLLAITDASAPTYTRTVAGKQFVNYDGFLSGVYGGGGTDNDYIELFRNLAKSSLKNREQYRQVCDAASKYLERREQGKENGSFLEYVKKTDRKLVDNELAKLMELLCSNSDNIASAESAIASYNTVRSNYQDLANKAEEKKQAHTELVNKKASVLASFGKCLSEYDSFVRIYQADAYYYDRYVTTAKNVVSAKCAAVKKQFVEISDNVKSIIDKMDDIEGKLTTARSAIKTYLEKVKAWEDQKDAYENQAGEDSFSGQSEAGIKAAREQYNLDSLDRLTTAVGLYKAEYEAFYNYITDNTHFKYGSAKISTIETSDHAVSALGGIKHSMPQVISKSNAETTFVGLYNADETPPIMRDDQHGEQEHRWYFLKPTVLPVPFLRYLNENYPEESKPASEDEKTRYENESKKYESAKSNLSGDTGKSINSDDGGKQGDDGDKFGYTYKNHSTGSDLPSKDADKKNGNTNGFQLSSEDGDKVNASSSFTSQSSALGTVLSGISSVAENTLEDSYVLSYIFDNFSYNTIVQEAVVEGKKVNNYADAITAMNDVSAYLGKSTMLSSFPINGKNNHIYGAEVEYILYGNGNPATNITYAKGSIYAIRFAFNCIYAFTNSEIRNETMSVGLAVQAATCGFVPYQLVQIVLQLALAAAESGLDLDMMSKGMKVAVLKSSETWQLSLSSAIKTVGQLASNEMANIAGDLVDQVSSGLQEVVDAGAGEIEQSVRDLQGNLETATKNKAEELANAAFCFVQSSIEEELNKLVYIDYQGLNTTVSAEMDKSFDALRANLIPELESRFGGNPVADRVLPLVEGNVDDILNAVQSKINEEIRYLSPDAAVEKVIGRMNEIKQSLLTMIDSAVSGITKSLAGMATELTEEVRGKLNESIQDIGDQVSEELSASIKEKVSDVTNDFVDSFLDGGSNAIGGGLDNVQGSSGSSVSSLLKFGYKDYLMLFTFIALCVDSSEQAVLLRIADVIQMNLVNGKANGSDFQHKTDGEFKMANARTYISINAPVELNMLFMNMDFFANGVSDIQDDTQTESESPTTIKITYKGLYGY